MHNVLRKAGLSRWPAEVALRSELRCSQTNLIVIRYSAQVAAAVIAFVVTWIILPADGESMVQLDQQDDYKFRVRTGRKRREKEKVAKKRCACDRSDLQNIALILATLGLIATVSFHVFLKASLLEQTVKSDVEEPDVASNRRLSWVGITVLLRVAMLYVASRLFITLATVYLPLYIEETKVDGKQALASVPLVSYVSSFTAALLLKYINRVCGTKVQRFGDKRGRGRGYIFVSFDPQACYFLGAVIGIVAAVVTEFVGSNTAIVYIVAVLIGAGSSVTMVTALSVTAELIGSRTERSAFVYSIVTFLDKIITGLVVIFIEKW